VNFGLTPFPSYQTPVSEDPAFAPIADQPRMDLAFYQWFQALIRRLNATPAASTATSVAGRAAVNASSAIITTEALTTASEAIYTLTLSNNQITGATNLILAVSNGTNTGGIPVLWSVTVGGQVANIKIKNAGASAFNGTLQINCLLF
jgi:hypothetical protein